MFDAYCPDYFVQVYFVRYIVRYILSGYVLSGNVLSGLFCPVYFVRYILSGYVLSGTFCPVCFVQVCFVRYILSGIFCSVFFCPGIFCPSTGSFNSERISSNWCFFRTKPDCISEWLKVSNKSFPRECKTVSLYLSTFRLEDVEGGYDNA